MPPIFVFMDVTNSFIPTAGTAGILPMITYFFLIVAMLAFIGNFVFILFSSTRLSLSPIRPPYRQMPNLLAICALIVGFVYYLLQAYYRDVLAELPTVTDPNDRQTLLRESYNALGQYRYMGWFITTPLLLLHLILITHIQLESIKRPLASLLLSAFFMAIASYIGHQQLSFDNEIQIGQKLTWGLIALVDYVFILFTLNRLRNQCVGDTLSKQPFIRLTALSIISSWGIYLLGYFLTLLPIDLNWIHLLFTVTDLTSVIGSSLIAYLYSPHELSER
ncbi:MULTISPECIES: bacteriorhodopsin [unclassified Spirosoma]|uniref:bacteriorhodopsin n=1 Tax=unclassified Spirosoma TaxID=2621999 RepID=UPI0025F70334|nr:MULTISPECIES: bacteriorhodopsin [unclassified Spirosoma]